MKLTRTPLPSSPGRRLALLGAFAGVALVVFGALPGAARASIPKKVAWKSADPFAEWNNAGFTLANNVLNPPAAGPQTIWANSYRQWGVESSQQSTAAVKAYPCVEENLGEQEYFSLRYLRSSFTQSMPSAPGLIADAAYQVWLDNHTISVMMWVDNHNRPPAAAGKIVGKILFYKDYFVVRQDGPDKYTFVLSGKQQGTGTVHLLSALRWLVNNGYLNRSDTVSEVDFGWEIASTGGTALDFGLTGYSTSSGVKLANTGSNAAASANPGSGWPLIAGLAGLFAALFLGIMLLLGRVNFAGEGRTLTGMFEKYGPRHQAAPARQESNPQNSATVATVAVDAMTRLMTPGTHERLSRRLDLAGVKRKPAEWAVLGACLGVALAAVLTLVTGYFAAAIAGGALVGWLAMRFSLSLRILRRRAAFSDQLPDILQLIASTLQAGFSLPQALDAVVREENQPAAAEISRALAEARIGAKLEDGLEAVANRMDSDDLRWTVMAIRIQQGVGGNLAEVLLTIAGTIRERAFLRRQVRALSAEGRLSAYVLVALPLVVATWLFVSSAAYMRPLYTTPLGELLLGVAGLLLVIGAFWMHRSIQVEV